MFGLDRAIRPQHSPVLGSDAKIDGTNINAGALEDLNYLWLKDNAATSTVEIVGRALEYIHVPADLVQQISDEEPAERPTYDQGPALLWAFLRH